MKESILNLVSKVNRRNLNKTQKVLVQLLSAKGDGWVKNTVIGKPAPSALRHLRNEHYGFDIQTSTASEVEKNGDRYTFYYRVNPKSVTLAKVKAVLNKPVKATVKVSVKTEI